MTDRIKSVASMSAVCVVAAGLAVGCETAGYGANTSASEMSADTDPVAAQIAHGAKVYSNSCATCHGDAGQGTTKGPLLVGSGAFPLDPREDSDRPGQFHTAMDIAVFATQNMPPKAKQRQRLAEADYWAVLAFALTANGVQLSETVGPDNAAAIVLH